MEIKTGSRYSGSPGKQHVFADPKQNDGKDVLKSRNDGKSQMVESLQIMQQLFYVSYFHSK